MLIRLSELLAFDRSPDRKIYDRRATLAGPPSEFIDAAQEIGSDRERDLPLVALLDALFVGLFVVPIDPHPRRRRFRSAVPSVY